MAKVEARWDAADDNLWHVGDVGRFWQYGAGSWEGKLEAGDRVVRTTALGVFRKGAALWSETGDAVGGITDIGQPVGDLSIDLDGVTYDWSRSRERWTGLGRWQYALRRNFVDVAVFHDRDNFEAGMHAEVPDDSDLEPVMVVLGCWLVTLGQRRPAGRLRRG